MYGFLTTITPFLFVNGALHTPFSKYSIFVNKIYLFDDRFTLILNGSGRLIAINDIMLDEIESCFDPQERCSSVVADAPGKENTS